MAIQFMRAFVDRAAAAADPAAPVRFLASTENLLQDGMALKMEQWSLDRFLQHPVILYAHDYTGATMPLGTGTPSFEDRNLVMAVQFDQDDEFAMRVRAKTLKGMMGASVGWEQTLKDGKTRNELLEMSVVPIPMDPAALPMRAQRGLADLGRQLAQLAGDDAFDFWQGSDPMDNVETRIGKVLSARNLADLQQAITLINGVIDRAGKEEKTAEETPEPERSVEIDEATVRAAFPWLINQEVTK
jgi:hypothetical protein